MADEPQNDVGQAVAPQAETGFKYGKCRTDHKTGDFIRTDYRSTDYMLDEPYATQVKAVLEQLGLPQPDENEIFRGTHHDMLFLDSHGVVVRIGPANIEDLMNPGILQPLGWIDDKENEISHGGTKMPFTIAIYPGIELYKHYLADENRPEVVGDLNALFSETGQGTGDLHNDNIGIIRMFDGDKEVGLKILLDPDSNYNASHGEKGKEKSSRFAAAQLSGSHKGEAMEVTLGSVFEAAKNVPLYKRAFQLHQPLRNLFWRAFKGADNPGGEPDAEARTEFWTECATVTNRPKQIALHDTATYRMSDGKVVRTKQEQPVDVVLYRPWTGRDEDNVAKVRATLVANNVMKEQGGNPVYVQQQLLFSEDGKKSAPSRKSSSSVHMFI